jgi:carbon dioxide concentrating mechanism protein CcmN
MSLPPIPIEHNSEFFVSGNVIIHETAVIAAGVILQAAPHSQIILREGTCLGKGTVLNAYGGTIEIEPGAILGAGVLLVGRVTIGKEACIGATSSIFNSSIESMAMIPSGSLLGDHSRRWNADEISEESRPQSQEVPKKEKSKPEAIPSPWDEDLMTGISPPTEQDNSSQSKTVAEPVNPSSPVSTAETPTHTEPETIEFVSPVVNQEGPLQKHSVIGKVYINQLLLSLFPERDSFKQNPQNS